MNTVKAAEEWIGTPFGRGFGVKGKYADSFGFIFALTRGYFEPVEGDMAIGDILEIKEPGKEAWFAVYAKNDPMRCKRIIRAKPHYGITYDYLGTWWEKNIVGVLRGCAE